MIAAAVINTFILFITCFYGKMVTENYLGFADALYSCNWLRLPLYWRKYLIIMIRYAAEPHYFHGSNIVRLDLETFTKVCHHYTYIILNYIFNHFCIQ